MTRTCSVGTCFSRSNQNNSVSMFRFPLDIARFVLPYQAYNIILKF